MLYHQVLVRSQVFQGVNWLGEIRGGDLHFVDFIKVRFRSAELTVEHPLKSCLTHRSNDYSFNLGPTSDWKALLLNKVAVGRGMKLTQKDTTLTQPPPGYDSVSVLGWFSGGDADQELGSWGSDPWRNCELR